MKFRTLIYVSILALFSSGCGVKQKTNTSVDERIVQQFSTRRIVMLADFHHGSALPQQTVVRVLKTWVKMVRNGQSKQRHLTLILEADSTMAGAIKTYLDTGDLDPYLNLILPSSTMERLEFFADLRRIKQQIKALNRKLPVPKRITFDVEGPEAMTVFNPGIANLSKTAGIKYFVTKRDSLSATNVITYLKHYPKQRALIFYGETHLITRTVVKNVGGILPAQESTGDYLAYYLKKAFGDDSVLSVNQFSEEGIRRWLKYPLKKDTFYESKQVPWRNEDLNIGILNPENFDAFVIRTEVPGTGHPLYEVFSKRILRAAIHRMELLKADSGALATRYYNQSLTALRFLTGDTSITFIDVLSGVVAIRNFDGFKRLNSKAFRNQLTNYYMQNAGNPRKMLFLMGLGFPRQLAHLPALSRKKWNTLLDEMMPRIILLNSIGIAMIGYPKEKAEAMKYLARVTRQNYKSPYLYLKWWRREYHHTRY